MFWWALHLPCLEQGWDGAEECNALSGEEKGKVRESESTETGGNDSWKHCHGVGHDPLPVDVR